MQKRKLAHYLKWRHIAQILFRVVSQINLFEIVLIYLVLVVVGNKQTKTVREHLPFSPGSWENCQVCVLPGLPRGRAVNSVSVLQRST